MSETSKIKVLLARLGLEVHWRGSVTIAGMLKDAGMEVIYIGNAFPEEIIEVALSEDVDVVGVSTLGGYHLSQGEELMKLAEKKGIKDNIVFLIGGVFPPQDEPKLKEMGFDGVFGPGSTSEQVVTFIRKTVPEKVGKKRPPI